jgi:tetratricopeptide (TPR) repeat protein
MDESASPVYVPERAKMLKTALFLQRMGSHESAIEHLSKVLTAEPYNTKALRAIAVSQQAIGDEAQARAALERLHAVMPDDTAVCIEIAESYQKVHDYESAYAFIQNALASDPNSTNAHQAMVRTLQSLGRPEEALKHRQRREPMVPASSRTVLLDRFEQPVRALVLTGSEGMHPALTRALRRHDL